MSALYLPMPILGVSRNIYISPEMCRCHKSSMLAQIQSHWLKFNKNQFLEFSCILNCHVLQKRQTQPHIVNYVNKTLLPRPIYMRKTLKHYQRALLFLWYERLVLFVYLYMHVFIQKYRKILEKYFLNMYNNRMTIFFLN